MDLDTRRRAWAALSELFFDTEVSVEWVARQLRDTGLSLAEIETILKSEVAPVLGANLLSVAGVWDAFDLTPVEARFRAGRSRPTLLGHLALRMIREDWAAVLARLQESG